MFVSKVFGIGSFFDNKVVKWASFWVVSNVLLTIHELGHYCAVKNCSKNSNLKVKSFNVGVPKFVTYSLRNDEKFSWGPFPIEGKVTVEYVEHKSLKDRIQSQKDLLLMFFSGPCFGYTASSLIYSRVKKLPSHALFNGVKMAAVCGMQYNILNLLPIEALSTDGWHIYKLVQELKKNNAI